MGVESSIVALLPPDTEMMIVDLERECSPGAFLPERRLLVLEAAPVRVTDRSRQANARQAGQCDSQTCGPTSVSVSRHHGERRNIVLRIPYVCLAMYNI